MKTEITRPTWEDVVFESRNKEYGAYPIRKSYNENISKSSLIALLFAAFVFGCLQIASLMKMEIKIVPSIPKKLKWETLPKIIPDAINKAVRVKSEQPITKDLPVKIVKHEVVDTPPIKPVEFNQAGNEIGPGPSLPSVGVEVRPGPVDAPVVIDPPKIFDIAQVMPEYEGGVSAMIKFLHKNLHYPPSARNMGIEGSVFVRFIVNDIGQVVDVEVVRGVNAALDTEAARVVALMRKWKPGMQHNIPVNVRMVLPIKFQLEQ
jgi:protein TonB